MEEDVLDIRNLVHTAMRWWWMLLLLAAAGAASAYYITVSATPVYEATAKILVRGGQTAGGLSSSAITTGRQLADDVQDLITTRNNMQSVIAEMGVASNPEALIGKLEIKTRRSILSLTASDPNPQFAVDLANTTSEVLIDDFMQRQLRQIAQFRALLSQYSIGNDTAFVTAQASALTGLTLIDRAVLPTGPARIPTTRNTILGGLLGLIAASILVFLREILSNKYRSADELKEATGIPILGTIPLQRGAPSTMVDGTAAPSVLNESYRFLRASLDFASVDLRGGTAFLVTSAMPGEGKTTTAINLALSAAKEGKRIILIDGDLRRPTVHKVLDLQNSVGLTNLLLRSTGLDEALTPTGDPNLTVLTSGPIPPDTAQVFHSDRFREILHELREHADMVIVDSPPVLSVADPLLLASEVDGVLVVVEAGKTRRDSVRRALSLLSDASPRMITAVFNKVGGRRSGSYYYYEYTAASRDSHRSRWGRLQQRLHGLKGGRPS